MSHESSPLASLEEEPDNDHEDLPPQGRHLAEDIANLDNQGFDVDDDNEPSPENLPVEDEVPVHDYSLKEGQRLSWDGIDRRSIVKPEKKGHIFKNNFTTHGVSYFDVVLHFLLLTFLADTVLSNTNDTLMALGEPEVIWGEFLHFLGILALMATVSGFKKDGFWSVDKSFNQHENHVPISIQPIHVHKKI